MCRQASIRFIYHARCLSQIKLRGSCPFVIFFLFLRGAHFFRTFLQLGQQPPFLYGLLFEGSASRRPEAMYTLWYRSNCLHVANVYGCSLFLLHKVMHTLGLLSPIGVGGRWICARNAISSPFTFIIDSVCYDSPSASQ